MGSCGPVDWICLVVKRYQWFAVVNIIMSGWVA